MSNGETSRGEINFCWRASKAHGRAEACGSEFHRAYIDLEFRIVKWFTRGFEGVMFFELTGYNSSLKGTEDYDLITKC